MGVIDRLKEFLQNTKRIIRVARRPEFQEIRLIARVSGVGILLVGGIAYLILLLGNLVNFFFKTDTGGGVILPAVIGLIVNGMPAFMAHVCPLMVLGGSILILLSLPPKRG